LAAAPAFTERETCVGLSISRTVIVILPRIAASLPTRRAIVNLLILVVDDEPDVEMLFRQQFRRDIRSR